jgi:Ca2+-transporting ATPase
MLHNKFKSKGLTTAEVNRAREKYGENKTAYKKNNCFYMAYFRLSKIPDHFIIGASTIYFISGKTSDGIFLAAAIILIAVISSYQRLEVTTL